MIIQKLTISDSPLYLRHWGNISANGSTILMGFNSGICSDTYFNSFSVEKWVHYCNIDRISLNIKFRGNIRLNVIQAYLNNGVCTENTLYSTNLASDTEQIFSYELCKDTSGVIYYRIETDKNNAEIFDAFYECETSDEREINIALNICTYKREQYLMKNISILKEKILENPSSPLYKHLKLFITDNAGSVDPQSIEDNNICICHNPNIGGAGGFTRGLLEILKYNECKITNVIFMDDDIEIKAESILRTYSMLRLLKSEFQKSFIAGAMLRLDKKYIQHENGALWNMGKCVFVNRGLDLSIFENVVYNEQEAERDYAAWWFCCIPISVVSADNLPLPLFIHQDDTEYSLRNTHHIITMNGISVWHQVSENRQLSVNEYYNLRNMLIVNSRFCSKYDASVLKKQVRGKMLAALLRYRYKDIHLISQAVEDFCKGPEWLFNLDAAEYHAKLQKLGYVMKDVSGYLCDKECIKKKPIYKVRKLHLLFYAILLNGWLLPPKVKTYALYMGCHPAQLFRVKKAILYDDISKQGIIVKRQFSQIFTMIKLYIKTVRVIDLRFNDSVKEYGKCFQKLQSVQYWNKAIYNEKFI